MIELMVVIVMMGVLAVVVLPRLNANEYRSVQFHDQVVSALRYAQKTATSHRRLVCVSFPSTSSLQLDIASANGAVNCNTALPLPGSASNILSSPNASSVTFSGLPSAFNFQTDGSSTNQAISISGETAITVVGATGYVQ